MTRISKFLYDCLCDNCKNKVKEALKKDRGLRQRVYNRRWLTKETLEQKESRLQKQRDYEKRIREEAKKFRAIQQVIK